MTKWAIDYRILEKDGRKREKKIELEAENINRAMEQARDNIVEAVALFDGKVEIDSIRRSGGKDAEDIAEKGLRNLTELNMDMEEIVRVLAMVRAIIEQMDDRIELLESRDRAREELRRRMR